MDRRPIALDHCDEADLEILVKTYIRWAVNPTTDPRSPYSSRSPAHLRQYAVSLCSAGKLRVLGCIARILVIATQHLFDDTILNSVASMRRARALIMHDGSEAGSPVSSEHGPITIKKYANRRLYNTATSCYVTLDYLAQLVKTGAEFAVYDAKTGEDITRSVLTHIIVEEESKGQSMLPVGFLRHLISFYGDSLQVVVPRYLEQTMQVFARNQERMRDYLRSAFDGLMPFASFEEMSKQQIAIFEQAMRLLTPFYGEPSAPEKSPERRNSAAEEQIQELRSHLDQIQKQLDDLVSKRDE